ncbi:MAG: hypothetical protein J3K34DRAFT_481014, partial [Monoraphidium minutum]
TRRPAGPRAPAPRPGRPAARARRAPPLRARAAAGSLPGTLVRRVACGAARSRGSWSLLCAAPWRPSRRLRPRGRPRRCARRAAVPPARAARRPRPRPRPRPRRRPPAARGPRPRARNPPPPLAASVCGAASRGSCRMNRIWRGLKQHVAYND